MIRKNIIKEKTESVGNKWMTWPLMWLSRSVVTINVVLQLLNIYIDNNNNYDFDVKVKRCGFVGFVYDVINCECLGYIYIFLELRRKRKIHYISTFIL